MCREIESESLPLSFSISDSLVHPVFFIYISSLLISHTSAVSLSLCIYISLDLPRALYLSVTYLVASLLSLEVNLHLLTRFLSPYISLTLPLSRSIFVLSSYPKRTRAVSHLSRYCFASMHFRPHYSRSPLASCGFLRFSLQLCRSISFSASTRSLPLPLTLATFCRRSRL